MSGATAASLLQSSVLASITGNAYRIIGVPGNATSSVIRDAVGRVRRWRTLGRVAPTHYDLSFLGAIQREDTVLNDAEGRLRQPHLRLRERLFWFVVSSEQCTQLTLETLDYAVSEWATRSGPLERHDTALLRLIAAFMLDSDLRDLGRWVETFAAWLDLIRSNPFWRTLAGIDDTGGFEPRITPEEVTSLQNECPSVLAGLLRLIATNAVDAGDTDKAQSSLEVLRRAGFEKAVVTATEGEIFGPIEDRIILLCKQIRQECSDAIVREDDAGTLNKGACKAAVARYESEIKPVLRQLKTLAGKQSPFLGRASAAIADCLYGLALDHTWADDFQGAVTLLRQAKILASSHSPEAIRISDELDRLQATAAHESIREKLEQFLALSAEVQSTCEDPVQREVGYERRNRLICDAARQRFDRDVEPAFRTLLQEAAFAPEAAKIAKDAASACLFTIAIAYTWADEFIIAHELLTRARDLAPSDSGGQKEINEALNKIAELAKRQKKWPDLKPIKGAPLLGSLNGVGCTLYGSTDVDLDTNSYIATYYFIFLFIPIIPLARYRVINRGDRSYSFLGKCPLRKCDWWHLGIALAMIIALSIILAQPSSAGDSTYQASSTYSSEPGFPTGTQDNTDLTSENDSSGFATIPNGTFRDTAVDPQSDTDSEPTSPDSEKSENQFTDPQSFKISLLKSQIDSGKSRIDELSGKIDQSKIELEQLRSRIAALSSQIDSYERDIDFGVSYDRQGYEDSVNTHNALVRRSRSLVKHINSMVDEHNDLITRVRQLIKEHNDLLE